MKRALFFLLLATLLGGCTAIKNAFKGLSKDNIEPPKALTEYPATVMVEKLWTTGVGKGEKKTGVHLTPAYADGKLYAISTSGVLEALDAKNGHTLWEKKDKKLAYAAGPSIGEGLLVVGTLDGMLFGLNPADGSERWHAEVSSELISAPAIEGGMVVVRAYDGHIYGFDAAKGERKWVFDRNNVPLLSLRGNSAPLIREGLVITGGDNGKVVALRLTDGVEVWEQVISTGEGRTEIERLQDVDGILQADAGVVYAVGYRGQVTALAGSNGRPLWAHDLSSYSGVAISPAAVFVNDVDSNIWSLDRNSGASLWKQDVLGYRWLSAPVVQGDYLVVGDIEGYVHWLNLNDGKLAARVRLTKKPIDSVPLVVGNTVYVQASNGELGAYRIAK